jgi:hypothetical protein
LFFRSSSPFFWRRPPPPALHHQRRKTYSKERSRLRSKLARPLQLGREALGVLHPTPNATHASRCCFTPAPGIENLTVSRRKVIEPIFPSVRRICTSYAYRTGFPRD